MRSSLLRHLVVICFLILCLVIIGIQFFSVVNESPKLRQAKETQQIHDIYFWGRFWQIATTVGGILVALLAIVVVVVWSYGYVIQKSTHHATIGDADLPIPHTDLRSMAPMVGGLVCAKNIEAHSKTKAFQIYTQAAKDFLALAKKNAVVQPVSPPALPAMESFKVPTFSELIEEDRVGPGKPLIFGYTHTGTPHTGTWRDLFSNAMLGQSGSGKTYSERYIIASSLLSGEVGTFIILDYAYPHPKSLLSKLGKLKSSHQIIAFDTRRSFDKGGIKTFLQRYVVSELDTRLRHPDRPFSPIVLVTDETLQLCKLCPYLAEVILRIGTEGRKVEYYGLFSSHNWKGGLVGGTEVRNSLTSYLVHQSRKGAARTLLEDSELAKQVVNLPPGQALFSPTQGQPEILTIPKTSDLDMDYVFSHLGSDEKKSYAPQEDSTISAEDLLYALQELCDSRPETLSKNQWQKNLASEIGVSPELIKNIMLGHAKLTEDMCIKLAGYLDIACV